MQAWRLAVSLELKSTINNFAISLASYRSCWFCQNFPIFILRQNLEDFCQIVANSRFNSLRKSDQLSTPRKRFLISARVVSVQYREWKLKNACEEWTAALNSVARSLRGVLVFDTLWSLSESESSEVQYLRTESRTYTPHT